MSSKRKICVVVTARPSYSRIRSTLRALKERDDCELQLVVAASALLDQYGDVSEFILKDGFEISARVFNVVGGESLLTMAKTTGLGIVELSTVFDALRPDVVVTIADRFETMATAVTASYMHIPLAHIQGGEITGSIDEKVRHSITKLSDLHLVATDLARERVARMGEVPERIIKTGCPSIDIAAEVMKDGELDFDPYERYRGVGGRPDLAGGYVVVQQHGVTNESADALAQTEATLGAMEELGLPLIWFWPNIDGGTDGISRAIRRFREHHRDERMHFFKNMSSVDFLKLIYNAKCLVGNSSVGIRESGYLGIPVVDIGSRQAGRERGENVLHADYDRASILDAARRQIEHGRFPSDPLYGDGCAGARIAEALVNEELVTTKKLAY